MKTMKRLVCMLLVLSMVLTMIPAAAAVGKLPFTDVGTLDWYYGAIKYVYEEGLMSGTGETTFSPNATTTRGMIVTILHRMESEPYGIGSFSDVQPGAYYAPAVAWASETGIVTGYGNGTFGPNNAITREQMAAILYRYAAFKGENTAATGDVQDYADGSKVSAYAVEAMNWAIGKGLISGVGGNRLDPTGTATRAQVATILQRYCEDTTPGILWPGFIFGDGEDEEEDEEEDDGFYTVTFNSNGGTEVEPQEVKKGEYATSPVEPQKDGYLFAGWFIDKDEKDWTATFDFEKEIIEKDIVLNAIWVNIEADSDQDGLYDDIEDYIGTDKNNTDTDEDGLSDYKEEVIFKYNPLNKDSDGDGIEDSNEDYDEDGLTNIEEYQIGTNPILKDSDLDDLLDGKEENIYGTNPINEDTDSDGANDGDEVRLGTDPLTANRTFEEVASNDYGIDGQDVVVEVRTNVSGDQVGTLSINPVSTAENPSISPLIPGFIDYGVDITIDGDIDNAQLTFKYDSSIGKIGEDFQPRIYYFNETTQLLEEIPDQTVTDGVVSVTIQHFSTYILLNKVEFDKVWETEIKPPLSDGESSEEAALDIMFVIDYSLSMEENDPDQLFKQLAEEFINKLRDGLDQAGAVKFIRRATLVSELTTDKTSVVEAINGIKYDNGRGSYSGTDGSTGIKKALEELETSESKYQYIVFITDGEDNGYTYSYDTLISTAKESSVVIYTVGMGSANENTLKKIANGTGGKYYHATTDVSSDDLINLDEVFKDIEAETVDLTADLNNDKIPDYYNEMIKNGSLVLNNGSREFIGRDFNYDENGNLCADFDGDGILNGDELRIISNGSVYMVKISDPMMVDSDGDGYNDNTERNIDSDPLIPTYPSYCVDKPMGNNWTHEDILELHEKKEWARELWSTITFNWSHVDESKAVLANFFDMYSNLDSIQDVQAEIEQEMSEQIGISLIAEVVNSVGAVVGASDELIEAGANSVLAIKKWISAGNSAGNLNTNRIGKLKAQLTKFGQYFHWENVEIKGLSKLDSILGGVSFVLNEAEDIYTHVNTYSLLVATSAAFEESFDVLEEIAENDNAKEKFVTKAAEDITNVLSGEYDNFKGTSVRDAAISTTENLAALALNLLSANPYVGAVTAIIGLLDAFTPTTKIAEAAYRLYVIDELVDATSYLVFVNVSTTDDYYDIENEQTRHIELLICARMWGNEFAQIITDASHYWGLFNDEECREQYRDAIKSENTILNNYLNMFV